MHYSYMKLILIMYANKGLDDNTLITVDAAHSQLTNFSSCGKLNCFINRFSTSLNFSVSE